MLKTIPRPAVTSYAIALAVIVIDQLSKFWVLEVLRLQDHGAIRVLPVFSLHLVWNKGVSFGLFKADEAFRWVLVLFAVVMVGLLAVWAMKQTRLLAAAALGLIMGGAVGNNFIDRVRFGAVVDFLDFYWRAYHWPAFNVADSAITVGVTLLSLRILWPSSAPG